MRGRKDTSELMDRIHNMLESFFTNISEETKKAEQELKQEKLIFKEKEEKKTDDEWTSTICNEEGIKNMTDLSHNSNSFVNGKNIDLTDENDTLKAVDTANRRVFGKDYVSSSKPSTKIVNGEFEVLVPNGDIRKRIFKNEIVLKTNVLFKDSGNCNDMDDEKKEMNNSFETQLFHDPIGFKPIKNMFEDKSGIIVNTLSMDNNNNNNNNNISINKINYNANRKLRLFAKHENRLTCNYVENLKSRKIDMSRFMFNRNIVIPETIITKYDIRQVSKAAQESNRAFFTGLLVGGQFIDYSVSKVYVVDNFSEYVGQGDYPQNKKAFPKAVANTFDGIAIDKNTRVIIYEKENFQGKILWDKTGPAIINNCIWKCDDGDSDVNKEIYNDAELQANFPCNVREWSETNMHDWSYGSLRVISNK